jgi:hypothetical protein
METMSDGVKEAKKHVGRGLGFSQSNDVGRGLLWSIIKPSTELIFGFTLVNNSVRK